MRSYRKRTRRLLLARGLKIQPLGNATLKSPSYQTITSDTKSLQRPEPAFEHFTAFPISAYRTNELVARTEKGIAPTRVFSIYPIQTEVVYSEAGVEALGCACLSHAKTCSKIQLPMNTLRKMTGVLTSFTVKVACAMLAHTWLAGQPKDLSESPPR